MGEDMNLPWSLVTWDGRAQKETRKAGKQHVLVTMIRGSERECHALRYWLTVTLNFVDIRKLWPIIALSGCGRHGSSHSRWNWKIKAAEQLSFIPPRPENQSQFENNNVFIKGLLVAGLSPTSLIATGALVLYDNFVLSTYEEFMHCPQAECPHFKLFC